MGQMVYLPPLFTAGETESQKGEETNVTCKCFQVLPHSESSESLQQLTDTRKVS